MINDLFEKVKKMQDERDGNYVSLTKIRRFVFEGMNRILGHCNVDVLVNNEKFFVIFTELIDNPGPSVTNSIENLILQFNKEFNFKKSDIYFFERYENNPLAIDEVFFVPKLAGSLSIDVEWIRLSKAAAEPILQII